jgi:hypothetical protein
LQKREHWLALDEWISAHDLNVRKNTMIGKIMLPNVPKDFELSGKENQDAQPANPPKAPEQISTKSVKVPASTHVTTALPKKVPKPAIKVTPTQD